MQAFLVSHLHLPAHRYYTHKFGSELQDQAFDVRRYMVQREIDSRICHGDLTDQTQGPQVFQSMADRMVRSSFLSYAVVSLEFVDQYSQNITAGIIWVRSARDVESLQQEYVHPVQPGHQAVYIQFLDRQFALPVCLAHILYLVSAANKLFSWRNPALRCDLASSLAHLRLLSQMSGHLLARDKDIHNFHQDLLDTGPLIGPVDDPGCLWMATAPTARSARYEAKPF